MKVVKNKEELRLELAQLKNEGKQIGFVPTMGALHLGHLSLINKSIEDNDISVCSIFVNPTQFNDKSDFNNYPKTLNEDLTKLEAVGCNLVFIPSLEEMYPDGTEELMKLQLGHLAEILEAKHRPNHFEGVVTIVKKLFDIVMPKEAYFGLKDYQQLLVIKELVKSEKMDINITPCPIKREKDGLAMSSRNMRLDTESRKIAPVIYQTLLQTKENILKNAMDIKLAKELSIKKLKKIKEIKLDYFEILNANNLLKLENNDSNEKIIICTALIIGGIRLIDNITF